jgi:uncharacterized protein
MVKRSGGGSMVLLEKITAFCEVLRTQHQFKIGVGEVADALCALEIVNLTDSRILFQSALRVVTCAKLEEIEIFDAAFQSFFFPERQGQTQTLLPPEANPKSLTEQPANSPSLEPQAQANLDNPEDDPDFVGANPKHNPDDDDPKATPAEQWMRGLFSAASSLSKAPKIDTANLEPMLLAAAQVIRLLRLGRSRKWQTLPSGSRFDFRKTLRKSLSTGGEPLHPFWLGHPKRNPRIVLLLDGSRSMFEHTQPMLQFAFALAQRSRRVDVFTFSTKLTDISAFLYQRQLELPNLEAAWGGGTQIGENLRVFLREHAARVLTPDTLVIISSDGLEVGETQLLNSSLGEIKRRSAGIIWLNPLASHKDFKPVSRGMKTALPFIAKLTFASSPAEFSRLLDELKS